jgi:hypothetical protein
VKAAAKPPELLQAIVAMRGAIVAKVVRKGYCGGKRKNKAKRKSQE